ncbi:hypothetical protein PR048_024737 [Dryococelus australis]|uniref:Uncharacterized protein n=1 Tax=Dryococelus australis TaxID=614101 RepID=A0ABQ9GPD9_9NEOP|nr:hypothetical protein PR048_024737 [Dryococelus australis]
MFWKAVNTEDLSADESEARCIWSSAGMGGRGETGDPRENPTTSGIVQRDSDVQKSKSDPAGNWARWFEKMEKLTIIQIRRSVDWREVMRSITNTKEEEMRVNIKLRIIISGRTRRRFTKRNEKYKFKSCKKTTSWITRKGVVKVKGQGHMFQYGGQHGHLASGMTEYERCLALDPQLLATNSAIPSYSQLPIYPLLTKKREWERRKIKIMEEKGKNKGEGKYKGVRATRWRRTGFKEGSILASNMVIRQYQPESTLKQICIAAHIYFSKEFNKPHRLKMTGTTAQSQHEHTKKRYKTVSARISSASFCDVCKVIDHRYETVSVAILVGGKVWPAQGEDNMSSKASLNFKVTLKLATNQGAATPINYQQRYVALGNQQIGANISATMFKKHEYELDASLGNTPCHCMSPAAAILGTLSTPRLPTCWICKSRRATSCNEQLTSPDSRLPGPSCCSSRAAFSTTAQCEVAGSFVVVVNAFPPLRLRAVTPDLTATVLPTLTETRQGTPISVLRLSYHRKCIPVDFSSRKCVVGTKFTQPGDVKYGSRCRFNNKNDNTTTRNGDWAINPLGRNSPARWTVTHQRRPQQEQDDNRSHHQGTPAEKAQIYPGGPPAGRTVSSRDRLEALDGRLCAPSRDMRLADRDLSSQRSLRRLPLLPERRRASVTFCREQAAWQLADWRQAVFSDDSWFSLNTDDYRIRDWRGVLANRCHDGGAIPYDSRIPLVVTEGGLTVRRYAHGIMSCLTQYRYLWLAFVMSTCFLGSRMAGNFGQRQLRWIWRAVSPAAVVSSSGESLTSNMLPCPSTSPPFSVLQVVQHRTKCILHVLVPCNTCLVWYDILTFSVYLLPCAVPVSTMCPCDGTFRHNLEHIMEMIHQNVEILLYCDPAMQHYKVSQDNTEILYPTQSQSPLRQEDGRLLRIIAQTYRHIKMCALRVDSIVITTSTISTLSGDITTSIRTHTSCECKGWGNGRYPRQPTDQRHRSARFPLAKIPGRPGLEMKPVRLGGRRAVKPFSHRGHLYRHVSYSLPCSATFSVLRIPYNVGRTSSGLTGAIGLLASGLVEGGGGRAHFTVNCLYQNINSATPDQQCSRNRVAGTQKRNENRALGDVVEDDLRHVINPCPKDMPACQYLG